MRKFTRKFLAGTLSLAMVMGMTAVVNPEDASAKKVVVKKVTVSSPSGKTVYVAKGKKVSLTTTVKVSPNKKANKKVSFKSANKKIATVNGKGQVKGVKPGKTKITVISKKNSKKKAKITVVVKKAAVKKITLNKKTASLSVGGKVTLKAKLTPSKNVSSKVAWTTSNKKVATVSSKGVVVGKAEGTAKITAKTTDGSNKKATCTVNVGAGIADVKVPHSSIVTVSLTSAKAGLTEDNFTIQTKRVQSRKYATSVDIEKVRTTDGGKTYDVILDDNYIGKDSFVKVTVNALKGENTKEVFIENIAGYGYAEDEIEREKGTQGTSYSSGWYISGRESVGVLKYSVEGLPAGLKAYFNKEKTDVTVRGVFANVENGTTATLKAVDEKGQTFTKKYVFYVGAKKNLVGNVLSRTVLSYTPDNTETKVDEESGYSFVGTDIVHSWACISGGSGSYEYSVSGLPAAVDTMSVEGYVHPVKTDEYGNYKKEVIPAGTYNAVLTVKDKNVENLSAQFPFTVTVTDGVTVTGSVKDATEAGMKQASVDGATKMDAYGYRNYMNATTKADGTYSARVIPGDYYVSANGYDLSIGNNFAGPSTKDFSVPLYKVTFNTTIAMAAAYKTVSTPYFHDEQGRTYSLNYDNDDYSLFAYMRKGTYEMQPPTGVVDEANNNYIGFNNTIYAYTKVSTTPYKDGVQSYVSHKDRVGERAWQVSCAPFTVAGAMNVTLTGTMIPEKAYSYGDYDYDWDYDWE
ncbi:MAG: Ig-like domain-containing protein [Eubacterium sp.]